MNVAPETLFAGNGEMATLMRSHDWSQSPLGAVENWSPSLRTALSICLNSRFPMVIWWSKELVLLYNDAWRPILGTKHPQSLGRPGQEVWAEIWDIIGTQLGSVLATGQATWSDDTLLLVDRYGYIEEAYFTYSYSAIFLETGEVGGAFTAVTETTRRVIGERHLRTLRELAANTVEAKSVEKTCQIATATLANNPYDIPLALLYLVEHDGEQARLVGTAGIEAGTPASPQDVDLTQQSDRWKLAQVRRTGEAEVVENLTTLFEDLPGGAWEEPPGSAIVLPIAQSGQKQQLAGVLVLGISPRREFDDEYRGFFDLVASNVATAIAEASAYEEERRRAEALAELDRAKTAFFSNVSHEFRTPLTLMLGPLEDMLTSRSELEVLPPEHCEQLEMVHRNGLRLQKLVNTLLDFSRLEAGRIQATYESTDLAAFTAELVSMFRSAIERAGMRLIVECPPLPEPVYVDREMWEKIVLNLVSNAFKFTFEGEITVSLRWVEDQVELEVRDTGIGIPAKELPHLFERFYRVQGARGRNQEGSGIGLSLVQELARLHGGSIQVNSQVDEGTRFTVSIPTGIAHVKSDRIGAERTVASTPMGAAFYVEEALRWLPEEAEEQGSWGAGEAGGVGGDREVLLSFSSSAFPAPSARILLADDNADMRQYVKRLLSQHYQVETLADGVAALAAARERDFNLILSDVMMPGLDGFELLRELRADSRTSQVPIILLSARAGEESRIEGLEAGADDYLVKPFSARELLARISATLKLAQLRQEAARREQELQAEAEAVRENLKTVLDGINDQFITLDQNWRYTYVNDRVAQMVGVSKEDLLGRSIWDVFPDTVNTIFYTELHRAVAEQTIIEFEYFYPALNRWFENRIYPSVSGVTLFVAEITDRKQAQEAQRQSEERFQAFMAHSPAAAWITDREGRILYLSQTYYRLFQFSCQDAVGKTVFDIYAAEIAQQFLDNIRQVADTQEVVEAIEIAPRPDGTVGDFLVYKFPIPDLSGEPLVGGVAIDITERKRAEIALEESEAQFRLLAENSTDIISRHSTNGILLYISPASYTVLGYRPEELVSRPSNEFVHPDDVVEIAKNYPLTADLPDIYTITHRARHKAGHYVWLEATVQAIRDPQTGEILELQASSRDITQRRRAEERLRFLAEASDILASSLSYETTLASVARLAVRAIADWCVVDIIADDQSVQRVVAAHADPTKQELVEQLRQYPPHLAQPGGVAEIIRAGKSQITLEISPEQMQASVRNAEHLKLLRSLEPKSSMCIPLIAREQVLGTITFVSSQSSHHYDAEELVLAEEVARRAAIAVDNAQLYQEARQSQQAAERAAARTARLQAVTAALSQSLTSTQVADVIVEQGMAALSANSALVALLTEDGTELEIIGAVGYKQELVESWRRFSVDMSAPLPDAVRTGEPIWGESIATRTSRYPHLVEVYAQYGYKAWVSIPLMLEGRALGGMSMAFTEERKFSQNDRAFILALAQQCAQALERARLYEAEQRAREVAEAANRIKDEFLAVLSHELRSPLNPILGWTRLLRTRKFDEQATNRALETIERNAKLQTQLIEDLLDISRILRGKLSLNVTPVDLRAIVEAAMETVHLAAEAKSIQIQTRFDLNVERVLGDSGRLQQIVWNLLSNAVKFTPAGGRVEVQLERVGAQAQIRVSDTGRGIDPEFLPYVFETFRQADYTTTRTFGGLGLGLAIVRHLVELHGGTVHAASPGENRGAIFVVQLPLAIVQSEPSQNSEQPDASLDLSGVRILAVDDDADMRELLAFVLEQAGASTTVVASAQEALAVLEQTKPDLLVSDVGMPEMDGYMLVRQLRNLTREQGGEIPAIALTAYAGELDQQRALAAGFQRHIPKPVEPTELVAVIATLVGSRVSVRKS